MLNAYVLIQTEVGRAAQVARAVRDIEAVDAAEDVTGPYDVIARVHARGIDELGGSWSPASRPWAVLPAP